MSSTDRLVEAFWEVAKRRARMARMPGYFGPSPLESLPPPAWSFGSTPEHADDLLELVLTGAKTATTSALEDYEAAGEALPEPGTLGIVLDSAGRPRALVVTTEVRVVPFDQVDAAHARAEGQGDLSLDHWRRVHRDFFAAHAHRGFRDDMPVVLERFELLFSE